MDHQPYPIISYIISLGLFPKYCLFRCISVWFGWKLRGEFLRKWGFCEVYGEAILIFALIYLSNSSPPQNPMFLLLHFQIRTNKSLFSNFFRFAWISRGVNKWRCSLQHERTISKLVRNGHHETNPSLARFYFSCLLPNSSLSWAVFGFTRESLPKKKVSLPRPRSYFGMST